MPGIVQPRMDRSAEDGGEEGMLGYAEEEAEEKRGVAARERWAYGLSPRWAQESTIARRERWELDLYLLV